MLLLKVPGHVYDHCSCSNYSSVLVLFSLTFRAEFPFSRACYLVAVMVSKCELFCSLMTGLTLISIQVDLKF